jgi:hypothetical protein
MRSFESFGIACWESLAADQQAYPEPVELLALSEAQRSRMGIGKMSVSAALLVPRNQEIPPVAEFIAHVRPERNDGPSLWTDE